MSEEQTVTNGIGWEEVFLGGSPEAEEKLFAELLPKIPGIQHTVSARQNAKARRAFHNKGDPVMEVKFRVTNDLPVYLRVGFLKPGEEYSGFGRFSRAQSYNRKDKSLDERGFAFRLMTEESPQDFLLSNTPVSFADDPVTFVIGGEIIANSSMLTLPFKLSREFGIKKGLRIVTGLLFNTPDRNITLTSQRYWSRTPFQLGAAAVKYVVVPVPEMEMRTSLKGPNFLTEQLKKELRQGQKKFKLCVQLFKDENKTPIEVADVEWKEKDSPLIPIGEILVPEQDLDDKVTQEQTERIENIEAFNPWNTKDLRPLGSMNRSRRVGYDLSAVTRGGSPLDIGR